MQITFASHNQHKADEIQAFLGEKTKIVTLNDLGIKTEVPETGTTIEENAQMKAQWLFDRSGEDCFSDDTGLEINALNNEPGVYSARYAGGKKNDLANIQKVITNLKNNSNRKAQFKTVIALIKNGEMHLFVGLVKGEIRQKSIGNNGFGYDSIFEPEGCGKTFAEMTMQEKNKYSHRARALNKMMFFLNKENQIEVE
jgi:XTP/dITP diphosphohydrolase